MAYSEATLPVQIFALRYLFFLICSKNEFTAYFTASITILHKLYKI